ncbi:MAG: dihydrolipoamide acetyltransferase family protein [Jatrophihabitans sp.]
MPDVLMPRLSDTMTEGILVQWLRSEGELVQRGDVLAEVETDKATMEIEAYASGVLTRILVQPGSTVPIGQPIAVIGDDAADDGAPGSAQGSAPEAPVLPGPAAGRVLSSPLARALARTHGLELARIRGTGPGGRVVRADVESAIAHSSDVEGAATTEPVDVADERIALTSVRRITAQRLTESAAAPHFYLTSIVDAGALLRLRADLNETLDGPATKFTITDLLIRACGVTLRSHPQVNSSWVGDHLLRHGRVNVGVAVALDEGLIVPVIRGADRLSLTEIGVEARRLTERARSGRLTPDEFSGGTFTISNLGTYGIDHFTAVINPPEAAILAVGAVHDEAVVRDGQLAVAAIMKLTLSVDHRVLDGATAAAFLRDLVSTLEHPLRIVL